MNDQLDDPANPPTNGGEPENTPESTAESTPVEPVSAESTGNPASNTPAGGPAAPQRRLVKKRKLAPGRRPAGASPRPSGSRPRPAGAARPTKPAQPHVHHYEKMVDEGEDEGFFGKHRTKFVIGVVALLGGGIFYVLHSAKSSATTKAPEKVTMVTIPHLPPPPPPPPPPPKREPPPPKEEKMVQETAPVEKKEEAPKPAEAPKTDLGTGVKGNGPGIAGLGGSGDGGGIGGPRGGNGGSKWGAFAFGVQNKVAGALRSNSRTNKASLKIQVRIWSDTTGRITRSKLDASTGDPKLDEAVQSVLNGLQLDSPPPTGMPMPIVMRLTARRP